MRRTFKIVMGIGSLLVAMKLGKEWLSYALVPQASQYARVYFSAKGAIDNNALIPWKKEVRAKAALYNDLIKRDFLDDGMVVGRTGDGTFTDHCDSLLFSALRYIALDKLGLSEEARTAFAALRKVEDAGKWRRHPKCQLPISRDMIIGVLAALTRNPPMHRQLMLSLQEQVTNHNGFVDNGPIDVSYLSPGIMMLLNQMAEHAGIARDRNKAIIPLSFPTLMLDLFFAERGYSSHLSALVVWINMELLDMEEQALTPRGENLSISWYTQKLVELDPHNMFFRWLRLKAAGALAPAARLSMLKELMEMPQFPSDRLPTNCDRAADYMWQRDSVEYRPIEGARCNRFFAGVDFIWMAALLVDDEKEIMPMAD